MEIESSSSVVVAKKVWNIVRVLLFMLRKGIAKTKIVTDLNLLLKRGKLAGKSLINNIMFHQHQFTCRSHDSHQFSFISPHEYEFSCSNTPAPNFHLTKRKNRFFKSSSQYDDVSTFNAVQKVLEILNNNNGNESINSPLPGFGKSPIGMRQLRVTDSPFPVIVDGDSRVDAAAEEFIKKFYKDLNSQKKMALIESPCNNWWQR